MHVCNYVYDCILVQLMYELKALTMVITVVIKTVGFRPGSDLVPHNYVLISGLTFGSWMLLRRCRETLKLE
jgi:hypothetical protein